MFQLGSALLDACVLAVISKGDTYGYLLTQNIRTVIEVSESTLYPVLRRLQAEQMLVTYDSPYNGRNRRYYQITAQGHRHLAFLQEDWKRFKASVEYLLFAPPVVSSVTPASPNAPATAPTVMPAAAPATTSAPASTAEGEQS
jgi:PadR family transcriptional regulator PadR